jgi:hypothetical protein
MNNLNGHINNFFASKIQFQANFKNTLRIKSFSELISYTTDANIVKVKDISK